MLDEWPVPRCGPCFGVPFTQAFEGVVWITFHRYQYREMLEKNYYRFPMKTKAQNEELRFFG